MTNKRHHLLKKLTLRKMPGLAAADSIGTLPALRDYAKQFSNGQQINSARKLIQDLQKQFDDAIKSADNFSDEPETACVFLKKGAKNRPG